MKQLRKITLALAIPAVLLPVAIVGLHAQPIFTTAPPHLQGIRPNQPAPPPVPAPLPAPAPAPAPVARQPLPSPLPSQASQRPAQPALPAAAAPAQPPSMPAPAPQQAQERYVPPQMAQPALRDILTRPELQPAKSSDRVIRHLTNNIQGFRLSGEIGTSEWPVYFTQAQAQDRIQFQLGYLSAVSVMPEASFLRLVINDTVIGRANIQPTQGVRTVIFDIPPGLIKAGFNSVRLSAEQRHRVDCSLTATYELWTQIDPGKTGFVLPAGDSGATGFADLAALPPDDQGSLPVRIVLPPKSSPLHIERIMRSVQAISLVGRFEQPVVDIGPLASGQHGINLVIGTAGAINDILIAARTGPVNGPRAIIAPAIPGRRTTVILTGRNDSEIDIAMSQMMAATQMRGTPAGLRAARAFPGYRIDGGERVKLRDMGLASQEFTGRLFKAAFNLIMPPDFYSADYGKATLDLAGGYSAGLTNAAQIVVSVNGRNAVSQKLPKSGGEVFKQNPIPLQLGHLRPGLNRIEIEAQVPIAEDEACDPIAAINGRKRFLFLDTTEIELPRIARIARVPDLAITATGGFPFTNGIRPNLFVPTPDRHTLAAAATFTAHLAIAAGKIIDFRFAVSQPASGSGPTLVIAPYTNIDSGLLAAVGLKPDEMHEKWQERINEPPRANGSEHLSEWELVARNRLVLQRNFPAACHMPRPPGGFKTAFMFDALPVGSLGDEERPQQRDLFGEWDNRIRSQSRIMGYFSGTVKDISDWFQGTYTGARGWIDRRLDMTVVSPITREASLIVAQNILGDSTNDVWTIVTAPNSGLLAQSVGCLVDPRVWRQVAGRIAVLNANDGAVVEIPATDSRLVPTQPLSIRNVRLIVAGWFSLNSKIYVLTALMIALLLAFSTHIFLRNVGRRQE